PEEGEEEVGRDECGDVGEGLNGNEKLRLHHGGDDLMCVGGVGEADEECGEDEEHEGREGDEEDSVAEVRDAGGDSGTGGDGGRRGLDDDGRAVESVDGNDGWGACGRGLVL